MASRVLLDLVPPMTGQRLFKRDNEMSSGFAVVDAPIPPPSSLRPGLPPAFDHIVLRALARERNQRYATALDLARELDGALANIGIAAGVEDVAELMAEFFADEQAERQLLMQSLASSSAAHEPAPPQSHAEQSELSSALTAAPSPMGRSDLRPAPIVGASAPEPTKTDSAQRARRASLLMLVLAPVLAVIATIAAVFLLVPYIRTVIERRVIEVHEVRITPDASTSADTTVTSRAVVAHRAPPQRPDASPSITSETRPRSPTIRPGFLTVMSSHPAEVFEGSRRLGRTPLTDVELRPGRHTLRFVPGGGLPPQTALF